MAVDQLTDDFVAAYADWLGVAFGEAYELLKAEPLEDVTGDRLQAAGWDESKHPRHPEGVAEGGQFAPKNVGKRLAKGIEETARRRGKTTDPADVLKAEENWARFAETAISQDPRIHAQIAKALEYNRRSDLFVQVEKIFGPDEVLPIVSEASDEATNLLTPPGTAKRLTGNRMSVVRELGLDQAVSGPIKPGQSYVNDTGGAPATLRHEYGHQVEAELTPEQREEFRSFMPRSPDIREQLSTYSDITGDEEFPEAFAVVTDPKFREEDWPEWAGHMRRFVEGLAGVTAAGWDPAKHPRHAPGTPEGGEFAPKGVQDTFVGLQGFERGPGRVRIEGERPRTPVGEIFAQAPATSLEAAVSDWGQLREQRPDMETVDVSQLVPTQDVVSAVRVEEYLQELREEGNLPELLDSVRVAEGDDGRLYIADGHNRVAAAMRAGHQHLYLPVLRRQLGAAGYVESEHPRWPAGTPGGIGGEFRPKDGGGVEQPPQVGALDSEELTRYPVGTRIRVTGGPNPGVWEKQESGVWFKVLPTGRIYERPVPPEGFFPGEPVPLRIGPAEPVAPETLGSARDPSWKGPAVLPREAEYRGATYDMVANSDTAWRGDLNPAMPYSVDFDYMRETIDRDYWTRDEPVEVGGPEWDKQLATYRDDVEERMREIGEEGELRTTTTFEAMQSMMDEEPRFKTQFETASSGGFFSPPIRAAQEEMFFGYPQDLPAEQRPIYGWLDHPEDDNDFSQYGEVTWFLKPELKSRTTVTFVDSLSRPVVPGPLRNPGWRSTVPPGYGDAGLGIVDVSDHVNETGLFDGDAIETQYHGGVTLDDVEAVRVETASYGAWDSADFAQLRDYRKRLAARGIRLEVVDENGEEPGDMDDS